MSPLETLTPYEAVVADAAGIGASVAAGPAHAAASSAAAASPKIPRISSPRSRDAARCCGPPVPGVKCTSAVPERPARCATDREVVVVAPVLVAGSEKAAAHRLGLSHSTVKHHLANARSKVGAETTGAARVCVAFPLAFACEGS